MEVRDGGGGMYGMANGLPGTASIKVTWNFHDCKTIHIEFGLNVHVAERSRICMGAPSGQVQVVLKKCVVVNWERKLLLCPLVSYCPLDNTITTVSNWRYQVLSYEDTN